MGDGYFKILCMFFSQLPQTVFKTYTKIPLKIHLGPSFKVWLPIKNIFKSALNKIFCRGLPEMFDYFQMYH